MKEFWGDKYMGLCKVELEFFFRTCEDLDTLSED